MDHSELLNSSGLSMYIRGIHIIKLVHFFLSISLLLQVGLSQETRSIELKLFFFPFRASWKINAPVLEFSSFLCGSDSKESACNAGDMSSIPGLGRSPGEGNGNPFQYSCLENPMDGGAWWAPVHGITKSQTQLSDFHFTCQALC